MDSLIVTNASYTQIKTKYSILTTQSSQVSLLAMASLISNPKPEDDIGKINTTEIGEIYCIFIIEDYSEILILRTNHGSVIVTSVFKAFNCDCVL